MKISKKAKRLAGSPIELLSQLELAYTLGHGNFDRDLNHWQRIVESLITDCRELNFASPSETNTWQWRKKMDKHLIDLQRLHATSSILLFMYPAFVEYGDIDTGRDNLMWFYFNDKSNPNIQRWCLPLHGKPLSPHMQSVRPQFSENTGLCIESGALKFRSKYSFYIVVNTMYKKSMWKQWECQWTIYEQMGYVVTDEQKKNWHKLQQWIHYLSCLLQIAEQIKINRGIKLRSVKQKNDDEKHDV